MPERDFLFCGYLAKIWRERGYIPWNKIVNHFRHSSRFGWRIHPIFNTKSYHAGLDLATKGEGHDVFSAASGKVAKVGWNVKYSVDKKGNKTKKGYGRYVVIEHGNGYFSLYGHLQKGGVAVIEGQTVGNGEMIALSGNTGDSTAPHVHFEIIKAKSIKDIFDKANKIDPESIEDLEEEIHPIGETLQKYNTTDETSKKQLNHSILTMGTGNSNNSNFMDFFYQFINQTGRSNEKSNKRDDTKKEEPRV